MANIEKGSVEAYIKRLISEEFGSEANGNNHQQNSIHTDGKTEPELSQAIKELASLYRSSDAEKSLIDEKIDELSSLERSLGEKNSS